MVDVAHSVEGELVITCRRELSTSTVVDSSSAQEIARTRDDRQGGENSGEGRCRETGREPEGAKSERRYGGSGGNTHRRVLAVCPALSATSSSQGRDVEVGVGGLQTAIELVHERASERWADAAWMG